jgi:hypothetical protein
MVRLVLMANIPSILKIQQIRLLQVLFRNLLQVLDRKNRSDLVRFIIFDFFNFFDRKKSSQNKASGSSYQSPSISSMYGKFGSMEVETCPAHTTQDHSLGRKLIFGNFLNHESRF